MFDDDDRFEELALALLEDFSLLEILEMNNLEEYEALAKLIEGGFVGQPARYFERYEMEDEDEEGAEII